MLAGGCLCMWSCQLQWQWETRCELCTVSTFVNTPDDEYNEDDNYIYFLLQNPDLCFSFSVCLHCHMEVWNFAFTGSDQSVATHAQPRVCSITHTIIFKLLILLINVLWLLMSPLPALVIPFPNCMLSHTNYHTAPQPKWTRDMKWRIWDLEILW